MKKYLTSLYEYAEQLNLRMMTRGEFLENVKALEEGLKNHRHSNDYKKYEDLHNVYKFVIVFGLAIQSKPNSYNLMKVWSKFANERNLNKDKQDEAARLFKEYHQIGDRIAMEYLRAYHYDEWIEGKQNEV